MDTRVVLSPHDVRFFSCCALIFLALSAWLYHATPHQSSCLDIDSKGYDSLALNFAHTGSLRDPHNPTKAPVQTVGYPFFVGLVYWLFGHTYTAVIWLQIVLMVLSGLLLIGITRTLFDLRCAYLAAGLFTLNVGFLVYPQFLLAESLVLVFLLLFIERFMKFFTSVSYSVLAQAGLVLGCSILIKPVGLVFLWCAVGLLMLHLPVGAKYWKTVSLFMLCCLLPLGAYLLRNKWCYGIAHIAPMMSLNMYQVFLAKVIAEVKHIPVQEAERQIPPFVGTNTLDESGWHQARALFYWYLKQYPLVCCSVWLHNVIKTIGGLFSTQLKLLLNPNIRGGDISFFITQGNLFERWYSYSIGGTPHTIIKIIALAEGIWSLIRWLLVGFGLLLLAARRQWLILNFCLLFILNGTLITGFDGCGRYRVIVEPILIMVASYAIITIVEKVSYTHKHLAGASI
jgi:dolichyl-phosphate-mannose-protein mannosyltransferase